MNGDGERGALKQERGQGNRARVLMPVVAALLAVGTAAGCGQLPGDSGGSRPEAELVDAVACSTMEHPVEPGTPSGTPAAPPPAAGAVPAGFVPADVVRCSAMMATLEDDEGLWSAVTQERLSGDIDALVEALARPSDGPRMNQACTADMELVPDLWLLDAEGQAMRAAWPTDSCGKTKPGVREVLAGMQVVDSRRYKVALIQPRAALDAGCPAQWSINALPGTVQLAPQTMDPQTMDPEGADQSGSGATLPAAPALPPSAGEVDALRICQYRATPAPTPEPAPAPAPAPAPVPDGTDGQPGHAQPASPFDASIVSGTFSGGGTLEGPVKDVILQAAADGVPAAECTATATQFAALWPLARGEAAGPPLTVELDACRRLLGFDGAARTVPDEAVTAVAEALDD